MSRLLLILMSLLAPLVNATECEQYPHLRILGSGGPDHAEGRISSGYLLVNNNEQYLIDAGAGVAAQFKRFSQLDKLTAIFLTHLHVDHSIDVMSLIKQGYFSNRQAPLTIYGPSGNEWLPNVEDWLQRWVNDGPYPYLRSQITDKKMSHPTERFRWQAQSLKDSSDMKPLLEIDNVQYISTPHGPLKALAYRIELHHGNKNLSIVFSGDTSAANENLLTLLEADGQGTDWFIANHAIPEQAQGIARNLHMPPSRIGELAAQAKVKHLLLTHRMARTLGQEDESLRQIRKTYEGAVHFTEDGECYVLE